MKTRSLKLLAMLIAGTTTTTAFAQGPVLEEVLVTAQKREQRLIDVPVSVTALSGEKIEEGGISGIERMADYIPSLNMTQTGIGTTISIRGISSGVNQGFEQSAAQFVDGIHFGRAQLSRAPFLDIERVEVLRGPQSILFGKNSTAGAISIITARPTEDFMAEISGLYEPEHGERDLRFVVSGPLTDTLSGRLAIMDRQMDGYFTNTTLDQDEAQEKSRVIRGTLSWRPDDWDITLKLEDGKFDNEGRNLEVIAPTTLPGGTPYSSVLSLVTGGQYILETQHDFRRQSNGDYSYNDMQNATLTIERAISDHSFTAVTGYNKYNYDELCDCDFIGLPMFTILSDERYTQWSQEIRIASELNQPISYIGGVFFQTSELKFDDIIGVPQDSTLATALANRIGQQRSDAIRGTSSNRNFEQDSDIAALFAQVTWAINDTNRLLIGGRYTHETKEASRRQFHVDSAGNEVPLGTPMDDLNVVYGLFNIEPYANIHRKRTESGFTPSITFQHDLNSTDMLYASFTTGFKSGGYDVRSNAHPDISVNNAFNSISGSPVPITGVFEFEEEEVKNYEIGGKFVLAGGAAELNVAAFRSEFTDLQTSQFDGAFSFNVTNAGEAVIHGVELEGRWAVTYDLTLSGGLAWLDFEYTSFPTAQCYFGQVSNTFPLCDATGKTREFTPEWQGNLSADHRLSLPHNLTLRSTLDLIFSDSYLTAPTLDPRMVQDSYMKVNARVALSGQDNRWEVALIGKNLTDESIISYSNGLPIATVLTDGTGTAYYAFYERPRSIALQGIYRF